MLPGRTVCIILVPVDTRGVAGVIVGIIVQGAHQAFLSPYGNAAAIPHPIFSRLGADKRAFIFILCLIVGFQLQCVRPGRKRHMDGYRTKITLVGDEVKMECSFHSAKRKWEIITLLYIQSNSMNMKQSKSGIHAANRAIQGTNGSEMLQGPIG